MNMKLKTNLLCLFVLAMGIIFSGCCKKVSGCKIEWASNYDKDADKTDNCLCQFKGIYDSCSTVNPNTLNIPPVIQQTPVWCWLAVGEMVFKYYGLPTVNPAGNYQCGIMGVMGYVAGGACNTCNMSCENCIVPAGSSQMISNMLKDYPKFTCKQLFNSNKTLNNTFIGSALTTQELISELNNKRPVIAGINPGATFIVSGSSQHVALITGYYYDANNKLVLRINDPYPYPIGFDPYLYFGGIKSGYLIYDIPYDLFYVNLNWNTSWYGISW
ncbi:MAG: hypothetical protein RLZZ161_1920 [Bacteroidota bacterium]